MPVLSRPFAAPEPEQLEGISTAGEAFSASMDDALATGPTGSAWTALKVWATDAAGLDAPLFPGPMMAGNPLSGINVAKSPMVTPDEAQQMAKDAGVDVPLQKYPQGIRRSTLDLLIDLNRQKQKRQTLMAGYDGWSPQVAGMLVGSLIDPANIGLAFVPVVGEARYAQLLKNAGSMIGRAGVRAGVGATEGAVGAALAEPLIYAGQQQWRNDYSAYDSLLNIAGGAAFGALLHAGVGLVRDIHGNPMDVEIRKPVLPKQEPVELRPAPEMVAAPEVRQPVLERVVPDEFIATTKAGEFRLVDREAPAGTDFSEFGQVRRVEAFAGDQKIGELVYANDGTPPTIEVAPEFRRQGVGTAMLKLAKERGGVLGDAQTGLRGRAAEYRTEAGQAFRSAADESTVSLRARTEAVPAPQAEGPYPKLAEAIEPTTAERDFVASLEQSTQAAALRQAVAQMIDGRPLDVTPAMLADRQFSADPVAYRTAVERAGVNGQQTDGANLRASEAADTVLAEAEPDALTLAKESLAEEQARVKAAGGEPEALDDDLKLTTDAVKAMTLCMMRSNG